jgi:ribosomal protein S18 acetylase RimI-like enzyme
MIRFRKARREDVAEIVAMLRDDALGAAREGEDLKPYLEMFDRLSGNDLHQVIVGEIGGEVVACYQLTLLDGLSLKAARRAQVEGVRVATNQRGRGVGAAMMADVEVRARQADCRLIQLTTNATRKRAYAFYERLGYVPSHIGFKLQLD